MLAVARPYVKQHAVAEEVVQETWLGVLNGLDRFEGRSTLKTWILRILVNTAVLRGRRERRIVPFSSLATDGREEPAAARERSRAPGELFAGHWTAYPADWRSLPEDRLLVREAVELVGRAIAELPERQQRVIAMRDVAGFSAREACETLAVSTANQRVLLHRARSRVRAAIESQIDG
jgi:RNA polymerase sigma-70 factor, ECF subfamily